LGLIGSCKKKFLVFTNAFCVFSGFIRIEEIFDNKDFLELKTYDNRAIWN